jgi:hypothetical protein
VTNQEIIDRLEQYQAWRKGGYVPTLDEITELLDAAIVALKRGEADKAARVCPTCDSSETVVEDCFCSDCGAWFSLP